MRSIERNIIPTESLTSVFTKKVLSLGRGKIGFFIAVIMLLVAITGSAQTYTFSGLLPTCPNTNNTISAQPANATFSAYTNTGAVCIGSTTAFVHDDWNRTPSIVTTEYNQFTLTADPGYVVTLTSLTLSHVASENNNTTWALRSSLDNFTTNIPIPNNTVTNNVQTVTVPLPAATFTNVDAVTFRLYLIDARTPNTTWSNDNVGVNGTINKRPDDPPNPTSNSPQCAYLGVTLSSTGTPPAGETWFWQTTPGGVSTANSGSTFTATSSGTYYLRARNNTSLAWSSGAGSVTVVAIPDVATPLFSMGSSSIRCIGAGTLNYSATAANSTGITYSLDAASVAGGNTIDANTGGVTFDAAWAGTSVITATATGCNGPVSANHTVTTNLPVTTPVFALGSATSRCQGAGPVTYSASADHTSGITYALDAASSAAGNTINATTGVVTYAAGWFGTTTITASAAGCFGPQTATHTITTIATVGTPAFAMGPSSNRCVAAQTVNYSATATTNTGITYSLDAASISGGNTIDANTGDVTFHATWVGTSIITATATGCNGPSSSTHTVTTNAPVTTPIFALGASTVRCQGGNSVTYSASANNTTGITYSLDAASVAGGNTINVSTGVVTYAASWSGTSVITASASGCYGPQTEIHTVTITPTVGIPAFTSGTTSSRCQGTATIIYDASATTTTGITYSLNAASISAGNTINASTGEVTFVATYSGTTIITASAAGCNGPRTATHTVTVIATVGIPVFSSGPTSTRCQGAATITYTATATTNTGIAYSLDAASLAAGNTINSATGAVTYDAAWFGTSVITATATGCNGPSSSNHTVTINQPVTTPVFAIGSTSSRCQGAGLVTYTATANHTTGITYSLDAASLSGGNSINASSGVVTYVAGWSGTTTITARATGCYGPLTETHVVTVIPTVGTPVFAMGATSSRCHADETITYTATATTNTGITYSLDAASLAAGNSIGALTGAVTYVDAWVGTTVITATATGCNGPRTATHTVTVNGSVTIPVFSIGSASTICQNAGSINYNSTANNTTGITYSLDAASLAGGNTINTNSGQVTYASGWSGTTIITASAAGCYGPQTSTHTVTITPTVGTPVFSAGSTSTRCQGAASILYDASATTTNGITYTLNAGSLSAGNTINSTTGEVTFVATYSGTTTITASAAGCNGPRTATHTVTVTATVGTPVFTSGVTTRCQGAATVTYTATATTNTGITYSLDPASLAGGNTINASTGAVTFLATWSGTTIVTATATGCNGPSTASRTVTVTPTVGAPVFALGTTSVRCQGAAPVTYSATATDNTGITYSLDAASTTGGNTINISTGVVTYVAGWTGTSTITARATGCNGPRTSTHTVTITPTVGTPVFASGVTSSRCQAAGIVSYTATATNTTGITYSLDAPSLAGGNTIDINTGDVTYDANWFGTSVITASAAGCNGPRTATHTVTTNAPVTVPVFAMGTTSVRCQGNNAVTYTATANHATGLSYSLDAPSLSAGNTINTSTGAVIYTAGWTGTSIITARVTGCYGPQTQTHTVTITPTVGVPVFAAGASSTRCQGAGTVTYAASSTNNTGITYSLDATSTSAGNAINATTGEVTYVATWSGTSVITATAIGCNGPRASNHTVTVTPTVGTPVYTAGATTTRCQGSGTVTYTATSTNNTGLTYTLDAASLAAGNTINATTGLVTYLATWSGTSVISVTASGCNGPSAATIHTVTVTPTVGSPVFALGASSTRCQGAGSVSYAATSTNSTGITYSLDATSTSAGNSINTSTGVVTFVAGWSGSSVITARATGCNGPVTSTHSVTTTPTVGTPVFASGSSSNRCQAAGTVTYTANATNTTGITYSLDASSLSAGNTIDANTGQVTYAATWFGTSTITATATGCNGPRTASHSVLTSGPVTMPVFVLGPSSIRCQGAGTVTYTATSSNSTGITYSLDAASTVGGVIINVLTGAVTYPAGWSGTSTIAASTAGCYGPHGATHVVTITPTVGLPVFSSGSTSSRCQAAGTVSYAATSTNNTGITYTLDATSTGAGNTINSATGEVTFTAGWFGSSTITARATGCNGPRSATHVVTTNAPVTTPAFASGTASTRCQGAATVTYSATANNTTGITYSLDPSSLAAGNAINAASGAVTYTTGWSGTSIVTASAAGCYGPLAATHTITITPSVGTPFFAMGGTSSRCNGSGTVTYTATATTNTGLTYSLDATSISGGNSINASTGTVTYVAGWVGIATITARATGCNGPVTSIHRATSLPSVATPVFSLGPTSSRCQGIGTVTYTASATNSDGIVYTLDGTSLSNGNTINSANGTVTYVADWVGTSTITATATGCNGPTQAMHTVTVNPNGTPSFVLGPNSTRVQSAASVTYTATANNGAAVSYSLDAASLAGGNVINASTGVVTFHPLWVGFSVITGTATGCNGPVSATHTVMSASSTVTKQLYLSDPVHSLDRVDPVATGDVTTATTGAISTTGTVNVAVDNTSSSSGTGSTISINHTTGSGTNRLMLVGISYLNTFNPSVQYVTYGGVPLTQVGTVQTGSSRAVVIYRLLNPASGAGNVDVVFSSPTGGAIVGVTTFTGVDQITPLNTFASASGSSSNASLPVNSASNELVFGIVGANNSLLPTSGNIRWNIAQGSMFGAGTTQNGAAVSTVSYSISGSPAAKGWVMAGISIKPSPGSSLTFTQATSMCSPLIIKSNALTVTTYINITSGTMPATPNITASLRYGSTNIITLSNPNYNSTSRMLTWTGSIGADVTVPAGEAISLDISTAQPGVAFNVRYDSQNEPSKIDLPVSTYIDINSLEVYDAPYPGGNIATAAVVGATRYVRATVTDPFGYDDITAMTISISPSGSTVTATSVATSGCSRTYEYAWTPTSGANYNLVASAKEGFENTVSATRSVNFTFCANCPPIAVNDSAAGAGGSPIIIDVLANDSDPNNNINPNSIVIVTQPQNGDAVVSGGKVVYLPNGTFAGNDEFTYRVCDLTSPTPLCSTAKVFVSIDPTIVDPCSEASRSHVYFIPFPEEDTRTASIASTAPPGYIPIPSNNIRTIISLKILYPNMRIVWDEWEDGYEADITNPVQTTTKVWGDGNPYNGITPGYPSDIIPPGGSIVLDNTMPVFPRVAANIFYDGRDKIYSSGQITMTQVSGEPSIIGLQCMKTNVSSVDDFGKSFTIPVGENFNSQDFRYTALFIRAAENNTIVNIDKDKNGTFELVDTLQEGQSILVNGGVLTGATITSDKPVGVDLHFGGVDGYSSRQVPIYPATWYSNVYYSPVPTTGSTTAIKDTAAVMLYNNLNRPININWSSGIPSSGTITLPAKTVVRFPLRLSNTAGYKFVNPTGESFTAIQVIDSYTPGGGGNSGSTYDWAFNLIAEERLTTFAAIAWAPGSIDGTRNDNPVWVTPANNTTIYVKYNGDVLNGGSVSPCGLRYDVSYPLNALTHRRLLDLADNDQSGMAVYTCDGTKLAAVYGEDPSSAASGGPSWDVGSTIRPYCATKLVISSDDNAFTLTDRPVTIQILNNDGGFTAIVDPTTVTTTAAYLRQPKNGTVTVNSNGTLLYTPNIGYIGYDTLEYSVCSMPTPVVCDVATVVVLVNACPTPANKNIISGRVFSDMNKDGIFNDNGAGVTGAKVYLYADGNCNSTPEANELKDSLTVDPSGSYQFITYPENTVSDDFDNNGLSTCASGSDGTKPWLSNWVDAGDAASVGFCVTPAQTYANTDAEVVRDGMLNTFALRLKNPSTSATRTVDLTGANAAFISFSYRKGAALAAGKSVSVQVSSNGSSFSTVFTINGNGTRDLTYVDVLNQDITAFASGTTYIRVLTSPNMANADTVYIDNIAITYLKYPLCYITRVEPTSVSNDYYFSTASQNPMVATSGGTCLFPFDFGLAKKYISISGTVYNDINGVTDNTINGIATGAPSGNTVYAYLVDSTGKVAFKTTVNSLSGTYSFPVADINTRFSVLLSTIDSPLYTYPPSRADLPEGWVSVGESFGLLNVVGTGIESGTANSKIDVTTGLLAVTNVDFGIEILPFAGNGKNMAGNPGGDVAYPLPANTFANILASSDASPGSVTMIRITSFPNWVNTMTINGVEYNRYTFPPQGLLVPTTSSGLPTQSILLDPQDGYVKAVIPFYAVDNAGRESVMQGEAVMVFGADTDDDSVPDLDDIDEDNDGITDFVETCGAGATSFSCLPGGSDPSADDDNDGVINYKDSDWLPLNSAGTASILDSDVDGIPDYLDLDSDNDGIADVVEARGVDANGDGIIDNFCDTDNDGLSQNVDANNTGKAGSGQGLGAQDFDGDSVGNTRDLDSDNDGIPDIIESSGTDANNDGMVDTYLDSDGDGWTNQYDGDPNGDGVVENLAGVLVLTGNDPAYINCTSPGTGRPGCYTQRGNSDNTGLPNFLDLDSDGDGITDAVESGITSTGYTRSMVSGCTLVNGWCAAIRALPTLNLRNTDSQGRPDAYDMDSDNDGITDNIEGQPTGSFVVATDSDTDTDGIANVYDLYNGLGGNGITPYDHDADGTPDYRDTDTDNDGAPDRNEGDNRNKTLNQATINSSGDSDGDGLTDIFDSYNLLAQQCGIGFQNVSMSNMGAGGTFHGPSGGSSVNLVRSMPTATNRDWRSTATLPLQIVSFTGSLQNITAQLTWKVENEQQVDKYIIQRSKDGIVFEEIGEVKAMNGVSVTYAYEDNLANFNALNVYYRVVQVNKSAEQFYTRIVSFRLDKQMNDKIKIYPNPVRSVLNISISSLTNQTVYVWISDAAGKVLVKKIFNVLKGDNILKIHEVEGLSQGALLVSIKTTEGTITERIIRGNN